METKDEKYRVIIDYVPGEGFRFTVEAGGTTTTCPEFFVTAHHAAKFAERGLAGAGFITEVTSQF